MPDEIPEKDLRTAKSTDSDGIIARLGAKARQFQTSLKAERTRGDLAEAQLKTLRTELDTARATKAPESDRVKALEGELRSIRHRAAFDKSARAAKVQDSYLDDLWELSKLDTSADTVDETAITAALTNQRAKRPIYFAEPAAATTEPDQAAAKPAPASGRGTPAAAGERGFFVVKRSDTQNLAWMAQHQGELAKAASAGTLRWTD
jgi:hypothetical protein